MTELTALDDLLRFDALQVAEDLTGESYKEDPETMNLGMGLFFANNQVKKQALEALDDTHYGTPFTETLRIYKSEGFSVVLDDAFPGRDGEDRYVVLWNDGLLATVESYGEATNNSKLYGNLQVPDGYYPDGYSGHFNDGVCIGYWDVREGLRNRLAKCRHNGTVLPCWIERPWLWLVNYAESAGGYGSYDHQAITEARVARLPEYVRTAITP